MHFYLFYFISVFIIFIIVECVYFGLKLFLKVIDLLLKQNGFCRNIKKQKSQNNSEFSKIKIFSFLLQKFCLYKIKNNTKQMLGKAIN